MLTRHYCFPSMKYMFFFRVLYFSRKFILRINNVFPYIRLFLACNIVLPLSHHASLFIIAAPHLSSRLTVCHPGLLFCHPGSLFVIPDSDPGSSSPSSSRFFICHLGSSFVIPAPHLSSRTSIRDPAFFPHPGALFVIPDLIRDPVEMLFIFFQSCFGVSGPRIGCGVTVGCAV